MIWFLKIGLCLIIVSLVLELLYCFASPINMDDKARKIDDVWIYIFGGSLSSGVISCLIWLCGLILNKI